MNMVSLRLDWEPSVCGLVPAATLLASHGFAPAVRSAL